MESQRQHKYSKLLQKELAAIFQQDVKSMFGSVFITVTDVKVSPDLGFAKVFLSFLMVSDKKEELKKVKEVKNKIRGILGTKIRSQVRIIPEIEFYLDESLDHAAKMENLFNKISKPSKGEDSAEQNPED